MKIAIAYVAGMITMFVIVQFWRWIKGQGT